MIGWLRRLKIRWDNRKSKCCKCKHFGGFYLDGETFYCYWFQGDMMWGDEENCPFYEERRKNESNC